MIQEPLFSNTLNLGSYRSGHAELGNSFLALLSGPPSLLQCDLQQLMNPKPICTSNKLPVYSSSVTVSTAGSGVPHAPTGSLSENLGYQKPRSGMDFCPIVSSTTAVSTNCSSTSVLHDALQAANLNLQSADLAKATIHHMVPRNEKVREFSSLKGGWPVNTGSANFGKLHGTNIHASQKRPSEASSSLCDHQATFTSGCPRVFCFGTSECMNTSIPIVSSMKLILHVSFWSVYFFTNLKRWGSTTQQHGTSWCCLLVPLLAHVCLQVLWGNLWCFLFIYFVFDSNFCHHLDLILCHSWNALAYHWIFDFALKVF